MPLASFPQDAKELPRIGYVSQTSGVNFDLFRQEMTKLGYIEGTNILFERRDAEGQREKVPPLVRELVQQKVSVLIATTNGVINAARKATSTIAIVMSVSIDPVAAGYVTTLARPGKNITGLATLQRDVSGKRIEMLREMFPRLARLAILWDAGGTGPRIAFRNYEAAAQGLKLRAQSLAIHAPKRELEGAFRAAKTGGAEVIVVVSDPTMRQHQSTVMTLSRKYRIPLMAENEAWVDAGALASYGHSLSEVAQRMAVYVDKILKGAKPADLPVEQPTKFDLAINMKAAKALGITIPHSILMRADRVIE